MQNIKIINDLFGSVAPVSVCQAALPSGEPPTAFTCLFARQKIYGKFELKFAI